KTERSKQNAALAPLFPPALCEVRLEDFGHPPDVFGRVAFGSNILEPDAVLELFEEVLLQFMEMPDLVLEKSILRDRPVRVERFRRRLGNPNMIAGRRHIVRSPNRYQRRDN